MKKKVVGLICDIGVIFIGGIIYAIAINTFSAPNKIVVSGVTGIGSIMNYLVQYPDRSFCRCRQRFAVPVVFQIRQQKNAFQKRDSHCHNICAYRYNRGYPWFPEIYRRPAACLYFRRRFDGIGLGITLCAE